MAAAFSVPLYQLFRLATHSNLHSHIFLIPLVTCYLLWIERERLPSHYVSATGWATLVGLLGVVATALALFLPRRGFAISDSDYLSLMAFALVCFVNLAGFLFKGRKWMWAAAFPMAFLIFFVPMPDAVADYLENASKLASADVANAFFAVTGTPVLRNGPIFVLPGITIEVAKECSGIRSSYVLFITSLLASYLFLRSPWRRTILVAAVIPLGLLRNGFRILVIALLCVHIGPHMINSAVHRRGGPFFFVASLVPLFAIIWWLRRGEARRQLTTERTSGPADAIPE
ncbi:MAG: exosortase/archaeosortase family protein [Verrucomicrobiota bacterium]